MKNLKRAAYAGLLAVGLTVTSVAGGMTINAQGVPQHSAISAVASLNPVSVEPADASSRGRWICNINWFKNLCQHTR